MTRAAEKKVADFQTAGSDDQTRRRPRVGYVGIAEAWAAIGQ